MPTSLRLLPEMMNDDELKKLHDRPLQSHKNRKGVQTERKNFCAIRSTNLSPLTWPENMSLYGIIEDKGLPVMSWMSNCCSKWTWHRSGWDRAFLSQEQTVII